jgi:hypothetical protein
MKPRIVVPGHGEPGGTEIIISTRDYIEDIERIAKEMKDAGNSIEDIKNVPMPEKYKEWIFGDFFYSNLRYIFNHLNPSAKADGN